MLYLRQSSLGSIRANDRSIHTWRKDNIMNKDQMQGTWEQIKGRAKLAWAELTDDDFLKAEGSTQKLYGLIQKRYGDTMENIAARLEAAKLE